MVARSLLGALLVLVAGAARVLQLRRLHGAIAASTRCVLSVQILGPCWQASESRGPNAGSLP
jgi:hypothetical protein